MNATILAWALWVSAGGYVHGGYLIQPYIAATFISKEECVRVQEQVRPVTRWTQCIQAHYILTAKDNSVTR